MAFAPSSATREFTLPPARADELPGCDRDIGCDRDVFKETSTQETKVYSAPHRRLLFINATEARTRRVRTATANCLRRHSKSLGEKSTVDPAKRGL
ncbi:hypothetical protein L2D14_16210 [Thalassospiraceae bacterium LMO-JJ14]|nr:hypothetical protein L2D14_16210 [Thalassospiraceae bacterium LMO-JJ14]